MDTGLRRRGVAPPAEKSSEHPAPRAGEGRRSLVARLRAVLVRWLTRGARNPPQRSLHGVAASARTGDIFIGLSSSWGALAQALFYRVPATHVGVFVRIRDELYIAHSTGTAARDVLSLSPHDGPQLVRAEQYLERYLAHGGMRVFVRSLLNADTRAAREAMGAAAAGYVADAEARGAHYNRSLPHFARIAFPGLGDALAWLIGADQPSVSGDCVCSEFAAGLLVCIGIFDEHEGVYAPYHFFTGEHLPIAPENMYDSPAELVHAVRV